MSCNCPSTVEDDTNPLCPEHGWGDLETGCICDPYDTETVTKVDPTCRPCNQPEQIVRDARVALLENLQGLRYAGSVTLLVPGPDHYAENEFLDDVSLWLLEYAKVLDTIGETHTEMARELVELRDQRAAIRKFLGVLPAVAGEV